MKPLGESGKVEKGLRVVQLVPLFVDFNAPQLLVTKMPSPWLPMEGSETLEE